MDIPNCTVVLKEIMGGEEPQLSICDDEGYSWMVIDPKQPWSVAIPLCERHYSEHRAFHILDHAEL